MAGNFPLQKWISNNPTVIDSIPADKRIYAPTIPIEETILVHALGLAWRPSHDQFCFTLKLPPEAVTTKRIALSTVAKLFDPLGFLSPVIIRAKIFIQELWSIKIGWDDPLPPDLSSKWNDFIKQLQEMPNLSFPR